QVPSSDGRTGKGKAAHRFCDQPARCVVDSEADDVGGRAAHPPLYSQEVRPTRRAAVDQGHLKRALAGVVIIPILALFFQWAQASEQPLALIANSRGKVERRPALVVVPVMSMPVIMSVPLVTVPFTTFVATINFGLEIISVLITFAP